MWRLNVRGPQVHFSSTPQTTRRNSIVVAFCVLVIMTALASCGPTAGNITPLSSTPTPTLAPSPTAIPTHVPTPTPIPTKVPQPTQQPAAAPTILDLRPLSMSFVGHLDCQKNGTFVCLARVLSGSNNLSDLHWFAFTNVPGNISFSPASGVLAPGQSVLVTITVPFNDCIQGLFFFRGPVNTHTITWAC